MPEHFPMNRSDLIDQLAQRLTQLPHDAVEQSVRALLECLTQSLEQQERIEIRGFGSWSVKSRPARNARNPKTGEWITTTPTVRIHFKPGLEFRERVNAGALQGD